MDSGKQPGSSDKFDIRSLVRKSIHAHSEPSPKQKPIKRIVYVRADNDDDSDDDGDDEPEDKRVKCSTSESELTVEERSIPDEKSEEIVYWLPKELWFNIFANLSFRDRKKVRSVCQLWRDLINAIATKHDDESLLCNGSYDCDTVMETIQNSARETLILKFDGMQFSGSRRSPEFWQECGPRIKCLTFSDCESMDETIECVVKYCTNLKTLTLEWKRDRKEGEKLCSTDCIELLFRMGVTRNSLTSFHLTINQSGWISNRFLQAILLVYPNVKRSLKITCEQVAEAEFNEGDIADLAVLESTERFTVTSIMNWLSTYRTELETVHMQTGDFGKVSNHALATQMTTFILPLNFPKLKKVKLDLMTLGDQQHHDFFRRHTQLTWIDYFMFSPNMAGEDITRLMNSILDSCPNLYSLRIQLMNSSIIPIVDASVFPKITRSRLRLLIINFDFAIAPQDTNNVQNNRLKTLFIERCVGNDAFGAFCKVFPSLDYLGVCNVNDERLQSIFQYQRCLKSLTLKACRNCTDFGFTGCHPDEENSGQSAGFSVQKLDKLQYLNWRLTRGPIKITERTTAELKLPNLWYLRVILDREWQVFGSFMNGILSNSPKLEGIRLVTQEIITPDLWILACERLQNLRYLYIVGKEIRYFNDESYRHMFKLCPTLRAVVFRDSASDPSPVYSRTYYYDVVKREVVLKTSEREYKISSQPIDAAFPADWLWY